MKFQRIGTGLPNAKIANFVLLLSMLLLAGAGRAYAVDEDLPPPSDSGGASSGASGGGAAAMPEAPALKEDESIPAPSIGDQALPEPSVDRGQEKASNQVNKAPSDDEIFLPTPNVENNVNYAPVGAPAPRVTQEDMDWRYNTSNHPAFSLYVGTGVKSYQNLNVQSNYNFGLMAGLGFRVLSLGQALFLHAIYRFSAYTLGDVGSVPGVVDNTQEFGGMLEFALSRNFSVFGTLLARQSVVRAQPPSGPENLSDINGIGQARSFFLGIGGQYDFYVIPHGSVGVHVDVSQGLYVMTLAISMEPAPAKKLSLSFDDMNRD
jgi:hypothetical protein